ncbi:MAG: TIR domain-containing protein [Verrucomicrobiota bacterium]|jgi:predicted nucleotide-binding protein
MSDLSDRIFSIADKLDAEFKKWNESKFSSKAAELRKVAEEVGQSASGSSLGYHSRVYYANFQPPPAGAHFSHEWGLYAESFINDTTGEWREYKYEDVISYIHSRAEVTQKDLTAIGGAANQIEDEFEKGKSEFLSVISVAMESRSDSFLDNLKKEVEKMKTFDANSVAQVMQRSGKFFTRDSVAATAGFLCPPHVWIIANVITFQQPADLCEKLAKVCRRAASHLEITEKKKQRSERVETNVFIGHGNSPVWKDFKDFIQDRLKLPWDEFNRVPVAGISNVARLSQMLDEAAVAFLIMTAEDEQKGGKVQARMNVIHEAGLFQGRLGFSKAIIVLEEGCDEFSNIQGLGQIRFPKGKIKAAFEEVRRVLEREGLIEP